MEDKQIVDLYWQRSDLAISETNQKYGRYCRTIAYNICGIAEDAEECVNDTWFRAWNLMPDQRPSVLSAFLGRITRSISIDRIKAKNRIKRGGGEATLSGGGGFNALSPWPSQAIPVYRRKADGGERGGASA